MRSPGFFEFKVRGEFVTRCVARATVYFVALGAYFVDPVTVMAGA